MVIRNSSSFPPSHSPLPLHAAATPPRSRSTIRSQLYLPRRSTRVDESALDLTADGDTWQERICVCETVADSSPNHRGDNGSSLQRSLSHPSPQLTSPPTPTLFLKSYFRNNRTMQRVWDEPPTGASIVCYAQPEERQKAERQLNELMKTLNEIPPDPEGEIFAAMSLSSSSSSPHRSKNAPGRFLGRFRRKDKPDTPSHQTNESKDINMQNAIARSLKDQHKQQKEQMWYGETECDDHDLALAKALSSSDSHASTQSSMNQSPTPRNHTRHAVTAHSTPSYTKSCPFYLSEDEMMRWAIQESQREASLAKSKRVLHEEPLNSHRNYHQCKDDQDFFRIRSDLQSTDTSLSEHAVGNTTATDTPSPHTDQIFPSSIRSDRNSGYFRSSFQENRFGAENCSIDKGDNGLVSL